MPVTKDRAKVGKTEFVIQVFVGNGDDRFLKQIDTAWRPTKGLAVATANRLLLAQWRRHPEDHDVWARIERGTWVAEDFNDGTYGLVQDARWEQDDKFYHVRFLHDDASITFDEE